MASSRGMSLKSFLMGSGRPRERTDEIRHKGDATFFQDLVSLVLPGLVWVVRTTRICEQSPLLCKEGQGEVETSAAKLAARAAGEIQGHTAESLPHLASPYKGEECVGT